MTFELNALFQRDLQKTIDEIRSYPSEELLWTINGEIKNAAGNLALHIAGNLMHFIGTLLGDTGYVRNRDVEFSAREVSRDEIVQKLEETKRMLKEVLPTLNEAKMKDDFPGKIPFEMNTGQFLVHLYGHLTYHLGQINYHRRLLTK